MSDSPRPSSPASIHTPRGLAASRRAIALTHASGAHDVADRLTYWLNRLVVARLDTNHAMIPMQFGPMAVIPLSSHDLRNVALTGVYEADVARFAQSMIRRGDVVVDVGAHIGLNTLIFASLVGPSGVVHAFEPNRDVVELLQTALDANDFNDRVMVHEAAVSDVNGRTQLYLGERGGLTNSILPDWSTSTESRAVPVVTLDTVLLPLVQKPIGLLKIDVEGAEASVLDGARELIDSSPPRAMIVEVSSRVNAAEVLAGLEICGYRGWDETALPEHTGAAFGRSEFEYTNVFAVRNGCG